MKNPFMSNNMHEIRRNPWLSNNYLTINERWCGDIPRWLRTEYYGYYPRSIDLPYKDCTGYGDTCNCYNCFAYREHDAPGWKK